MTIIYGDGASSLSWADACTKMRGDLWRPGSSGIPDDVCDRALHAALRKLESERRWKWLEAINATLTMDAAGASIVAPSDLGRVASIAYLSGPAAYDLLTVESPQVVRASAVGTYSGAPSFYATGQGNIYFDCNVAAGAQFELIYDGRTPDSIDIAKSNPPYVLTLQQNPILALACADVAMGYLKNEDEAARQMQRYSSMLETLFNEDDDARDDEFGGAVVPDTALYDAAYGGWRH